MGKAVVSNEGIEIKMSENTIQSTDPLQSQSVQRVLQLIPLVLLAIAHLPFVLTEYRSLWLKEHYQFFPLALISFAVYFQARRLPSTFHWQPICWVLVVLDVVLLSFGSGLTKLLMRDGLATSPYLTVVGFWLLASAICIACSDRQAKRSLVYLIVLPLITIRPPLGYDQSLILWLQRVTSGVASEVLNFLGYLHLRSGVILNFPGMSFQVEDACSGVQSLYAVLFLAAFVTCGYRRGFFHSVVVIASGLMFAGVMNVIRISVIAIAWEIATVDLTSGLIHDVIGYAALFAAAMLVFSADAFLAFCFDPVPDVPGAGITALYRNPFVAVWNKLFMVIPRGQELAVQGTALSSRFVAALSVCALILCVSCLILQTRNLGWISF